MAQIPNLQSTNTLGTDDQTILRQGTIDKRISLELAGTLSWAKRNGYTHLGTHITGLVFPDTKSFSTYQGKVYFVKGSVSLPYTAISNTPDSDTNLTAEVEVTKSNISDYTDIVYSSVANMIAGIPVTATEGDIISTAGYYFPGDGGGARYLIVSGNSGDGFGSHNIGVHTAKIVIDGSLNAAQFGAARDITRTPVTLPYKTATINTTSYTAQSSLNAIQACVNYARDNNIGTIVGGGKSYMLNGGERLIFQGVDNVDVKDMVVYGTGTFYVDGCKNLEINGITWLGENDLVTPPFQVIDHTDGDANTPNTVWWLDHDQIGYGENHEAVLIASHTNFGYNENIKITNCHVQMRTNAFNHESLAGETGLSSNILITGNTTDHIWWHGAGLAYTDGGVVSNNTFKNHFVGSAFGFSSGCTSCIGQGNYILGIPVIGKTAGESDGVTGVPRNCQILDNTFISPIGSDVHFKSYYAYSVEGDDTSVIRGNKITLNREVNNIFIADTSCVISNNYVKALVPVIDRFVVLGFHNITPDRRVVIENNTCIGSVSSPVAITSEVDDFSSIIIRNNYFSRSRDGMQFNVPIETLEFTHNTIEKQSLDTLPQVINYNPNGARSVSITDNTWYLTPHITDIRYHMRPTLTGVVGYMDISRNKMLLDPTADVTTLAIVRGIQPENSNGVVVKNFNIRDNIVEGSTELLNIYTGLNVNADSCMMSGNTLLARDCNTTTSGVAIANFQVTDSVSANNYMINKSSSNKTVAYSGANENNNVLVGDITV